MTAQHLPVLPVTLPDELLCQRNGELPPEVLRPIGAAGSLCHTAARAWDALWSEARTFGWDLTWTFGGTYRTLRQQQSLFFSRWSAEPIAGRERVFYNGGDWYLRRGVARAAIPGTSNHGLGIAVDVALGAEPADAKPITPALSWLLDHAGDFGWSWEVQSEPWHLRYWEGSTLPPAVLDWEDRIQSALET